MSYLPDLIVVFFFFGFEVLFEPLSLSGGGFYEKIFQEYLSVYFFALNCKGLNQVELQFLAKNRPPIYLIFLKKKV